MTAARLFLFSGTVARKDSGDIYKIHFMPTIYKGNASDSGDAKWETAQMWAEATGLDFAPQASFWAGKRYHRGADIHIVDTFFEKPTIKYWVISTWNIVIDALEALSR